MSIDNFDENDNLIIEPDPDIVEDNSYFLWESQNLSDEIAKYLGKYGEDLDAVAKFFPEDDPYQQQLLDSYSDFTHHLGNALRSIEYLKHSSFPAGKLRFNAKKNRYFNDDGELHAGELLEVLLPPDGYYGARWFLTRIEYDLHEWYLTDVKKSIKLEGLETQKRFDSRPFWSK